MASEQLSRRENKSTEREFEHLSDQVKESDVAGANKDTPPLQAHFESLSDQVHKGTGHSYADKARSTNVPHQQQQHANVGKFEVRAQPVRDANVPHLQSRTREVSGRSSIQESLAPTTTLHQENRAGGQQVKGRVGVATEGPTAVITCKFEGVENRDHNGELEEAEREEQRRNQQQQQQSQSTMEDISKYRGQVQENTMQALRGAQDRYERAKQTAPDTIGSTTQTAQQKAAQAKNTAMEKGYVAASYVGETGKTAAEYAGKVAADLKDKAAVAGWTAADYTTKATVEGTKAVANVVQGTAGYAANKATEIAAKSLGAVKGLAAAAGETADQYTARKKEEAKRASSQQHQQVNSISTFYSFQGGIE